LAVESSRRIFIDAELVSETTAHTPAELRQSLTDGGYSEVVPSRWADKAVWQVGAAAVQSVLAAAHSARHEPIAEKDLRRPWVAASQLNGKLLGEFLAAMATRGEIRRQGQGFLPQVSAVAQDPAERARRQKARDWLAKAAGEPAGFREAPAEVKKAARDLARDGEWIALGEEFFWEAAPYAAVKGRVEAHLREKTQATTSDLKTTLGLSRKIAVLLLEQLDRDRVTYLKDGVRRLLKG
jgi:hypothetical protein